MNIIKLALAAATLAVGLAASASALAGMAHCIHSGIPTGLEAAVGQAAAATTSVDRSRTGGMDDR